MEKDGVSGAEPLGSPGRSSDRRQLIAIFAVVVAVVLIGAVILYGQLSQEEEDHAFNLVFTESESWEGFSGTCTGADGSVDWEKVSVRLSSGTMSVTWSNLVQPTLAGPISYTMLDCGEQTLGSWTVTLLAWNYGTGEGLGLSDYLYFKFSPIPQAGDAFSVTLLHEPSGDSIAVFEHIVE